MIRRKPVIDVKQILDLAAGLDAAGHEKVLRSAAQLHCVAVDVETAETDHALGHAHAGGAVGGAAGLLADAVGRRGAGGDRRAALPRRRDGLADPRAEALAAGATHVLALQTRPFGVPRRSAIRAADWFIERHLGRLNPALVDALPRRVAEYEELVEDIGRRSAEASVAPPHVLGIRPAAGTPCVGQLERRSAVLAAAAADAERLVEAALSTGSWLRVTRGVTPGNVRAERHSLVGDSSMPSQKRRSTSFSGVSAAPPRPR